MTGTRHPARPAGLLFAAAALLALLALAVFPLFAHADSSGVQYSDAPPTATGDKKPPNGQDPATKSSTKGGGSGSGESSTGSDKSSGASGTGSSANIRSSESGDASGGDGERATGQQGSPDGADPGTSDSSDEKLAAAAGSGDGDGGSSPLVPVLIAIGVLAAASFGWLLVKQRRARRAAAQPPVAPKAG